MQRLIALSSGVLFFAVSACTAATPSTAASPPAPTSAPPATVAAQKPSASPSSSPSSPSTSPSPGLVASPSPFASAVASPSAVAGAAPRPANATLTISSPTAGQTMPAGSVTVSVQYTGPQLVAAANATKLDDYHLHYFLDEDATSYIGTLAPVPTGNPRIVHTANLSTTFDNVAAGSHMVTVALAGANHVTVAPPLSAQVTFTVQ